MSENKKALDYHQLGKRPGKIGITSTKACKTQEDLAMAYTPGVAAPCLEIKKDPLNAFKYTSRGNLVAVISNGTAVLGLGNLGALASKPVMEGKAVLFKEFADIDVFDLEINETDPDKLVAIIKSLEPTFGGINLEDIKAPECFYIEEKLSDSMNIPVFHDDQHGTSTITAAAFLNALEISKQKASDVQIVFSGAGAAAVACAKTLLKLGVKRENIFMYDTQGLVVTGRKQIEYHRAFFAQNMENKPLAEVIKDKNVFIGLSTAGVLTPDMLKTMAPNAIVFAMANPNPEIDYNVARATRSDIIMATGRSDFPNQVNNVLGFPSIFRGALDVGATKINEEMRLAAVYALAELAKKPVPLSVCQAYGLKSINFGPDYIIPKPFDHRVLLAVAPEVAKAAMDTGVALRPIADLDAYRLSLAEHLKAHGREVVFEDTNF